MRQLIAALVFVSLVVASPARAVTTWCADATNGSDANSGVAAGTVPNLTNCKQSIEAACALLTTGDTLLVDDDYYHDPVFGNTSLDMCPIPTTAANVTITSYGPTLWPGIGSDPASDASVSAILDGSDCAGKLQGVCATATTGVKTWTNVSGNIWKTAEAAYPFFVYLDNIQGWPDAAGGLKSAACATGTCAQSVTNPSQLATWVGPSHVYAANACVQNGTYPAEWFCTTAGGTSGSTTPLCDPSLGACTAGSTTRSDGGVTWTLEGVAQATIGPMVAGSWFWDGVSIYVWTPDGTNPNTHVVEIANKLNGIHVNVNGTGNNGLQVNHIGFQRIETGLLVFDTSGSGNCIANMVFDHLYFNQTGTSNIDVGMFGNAMRLTGSDPTCNPAYQVTHSYFTNCGEHGGCLTGQVVGGSTFSFLNCGPENHGCVNLTQNGSTNPGANVTISNSYCHDQTKSQNASVATDSVSCFYAQNTTGLVIKNNIAARVLDAGCGGGGQCTGVLLAGTTGSQIINNTVSNAQHMFAETSGFPNTGLKLINNTCDHMVSEGTTGSCINLIAAADLTTSNLNILPSNGTTVALINGVTQTFAAWQLLGFDPSSSNTVATFQRGVQWPFDLTPGNVGYGAADQGQGNGANIGATVVLSRSPNPLDKQSVQNGY